MYFRFLFLLICFVLKSTTLHAQFNLDLGGKAGLNISTLVHSDEIDYQPKTGLILGPTIELTSPYSQFSVQSEILFFQNGARFKESGTELEINYLQVPLLIKYRLDTPLSDRSPVFIFGPYYNLHITTEGRIPGFFAPVSLSDLTNTSAMGIILGAEISFQSVHIGLQSNIDISNTYKKLYSTGERNFGIALVAGFTF